MKDLDLKDLRSALTHIDWRSFRGADLRRAKGALQGSLKDLDRSAVFAARAGVDGMKHMRRDHDAERRNTATVAAVGAVVVGAALMYFLDPERGEMRRSSARERLTHWYVTGRGQLDHDWRRLQAESHSFDLTEKGRSGDDPMDTHSRTPSEETPDLHREV